MNSPFAYQRSAEWYAARVKKHRDPRYPTDEAKYRHWRRRVGRKYKALIERATEEVAHLVPGHEQRGWDTYHIDHKVSINEGFKRGFPVSWMADLSNLRVIPKELNYAKGTRCVGSTLRMMMDRLNLIETRGTHVIEL